MDEFTFAKFLETVPPGRSIYIQDRFLQLASDSKTKNAYIFTTPIQLYCANADCAGIRYFTPRNQINAVPLSADKINDNFLVYGCKNCDITLKTFAVRFTHDDTTFKWIAYKYGEIPSFGPPIPGRFIKLIGPDKDLFLSGRRSENQGLGIGAFGYYRRVVENQKNRIFDEVIRVINTIEPGNAIIAELEAAKSETQFSKAIDSIKHGLPQSLMIGGHNPLMLLHAALSEGLHAQTDDECLALATDIRVVLVEFAEKLGQALKDDAELSEAVKRLAAKKK